jgi:drug/metabolite transporter (DMT)-like permease
VGGPLLAVLGGLGAAVCFTVSALCASSSSRAIGAESTLAWVMLTGMVLVAPAVAVRGAVLALPVALLFGVTLYTTGRAGQQVSVLWVLVPARLFGSALAAGPLAARRRLRLTRRALPLVAAAGAAEVLGVVSYAIGARHQLAVAAVLQSQFAAMTAVAAFVIHGHRLSRSQVAGLAAIVTGVTLLSALGP